MTVSGEQLRDSAIHIHVSILPSHRGCHITLSRVPCAIPWVLVGYLFEIQQCVHVHPKLPNYPFLPLILTPATISSFSKSVSLKVPPKKSISLELLPIDLHCFSSIHHWPHTNPPIPSSPNKDHMLPQICQKKKKQTNPSLPTSLFFFRLSISFSNHSWGVTIWRPLISLMRSGHPLFWNLQWLPRASLSSSSLVWHSRPSSVCPT